MQKGDCFPLNSSIGLESIRLTDKSTPSYWRNLLAWDSMLFFVVCSLDMLSTLLWVREGIATESNPWLAACLRVSPLCFCFAKSLSYLPVLFVCAYFRSAYPRCVALSLRYGILLYATIYGLCVGLQFLR